MIIKYPVSQTRPYLFFCVQITLYFEVKGQHIAGSRILIVNAYCIVEVGSYLLALLLEIG